MDQMLKWMSKELKFRKVNSSLFGKLACIFALTVPYFSWMGSACLPTSVRPAQQGSQWGNCLMLLSQQCPPCCDYPRQTVQRQMVSTDRSHCSYGSRMNTAASVPFFIPKLCLPLNEEKTKKQENKIKL